MRRRINFLRVSHHLCQRRDVSRKQSLINQVLIDFICVPFSTVVIENGEFDYMIPSAECYRRQMLNSAEKFGSFPLESNNHTHVCFHQVLCSGAVFLHLMRAKWTTLFGKLILFKCLSLKLCLQLLNFVAS